MDQDLTAVADVYTKLPLAFAQLQEAGTWLWKKERWALTAAKTKALLFPEWGLGYEVISCDGSGVRIFADNGSGREPTNERFEGEFSQEAEAGDVCNLNFQRLFVTIPADQTGHLVLLIHRTPASMRGTDRERNRTVEAGGDISGAVSAAEVVADAPAVWSFPKTSSLISVPSGAAGIAINLNITAQTLGVSPSLSFEFYDADDERAMSDPSGYFHSFSSWDPAMSVPSGPPYKFTWWFHPSYMGTGLMADLAVNEFIGAAPPRRIKVYSALPVDITSLTAGWSYSPLF